MWVNLWQISDAHTHGGRSGHSVEEVLGTCKSGDQLGGVSNYFSHDFPDRESNLIGVTDITYI